VVLLILVNIICSHENHYSIIHTLLYILGAYVDEDEFMNDGDGEEEQKTRHTVDTVAAILAEERRKLNLEKKEAQDRLDEERRDFDKSRCQHEIVIAQQKKATEDAERHLSETLSQRSEQQQQALKIVEQQREAESSLAQQQEQLRQQQEQLGQQRAAFGQQQAALVQQQQQAALEHANAAAAAAAAAAHQLVQQQEQQEQAALEHDSAAAQQLKQQQQQQQQASLVQQQERDAGIILPSSPHATAAAGTDLLTKEVTTPPAASRNKDREYTSDRTKYPVVRGEERKDRHLKGRAGQTVSQGVQRDKRLNDQKNNLSKKRDENILRKRAAAVTPPHPRRSSRNERTVVQTPDMWNDIAKGALNHQDISDQGDAAEKAMMG